MVGTSCVSFLQSLCVVFTVKNVLAPYCGGGHSTELQNISLVVKYLVTQLISLQTRENLGNHIYLQRPHHGTPADFTVEFAHSGLQFDH